MKVALVTGSGRGIGRSIAESLAQNGFDIGIVDIAAESAAEAARELGKEYGVRALAIVADISRSSDRTRIVEMMKAEFGRLDLLVNNAGVAPRVRLDILQATEESYDWVMNINLKGPYFLTQLVANWMVAQKQADGSFDGKIINISSMSAYTSSPARGEYCLSKAAMSMMTQLYADRLAEFRIQVFELRPGIIKTDMTAAVADKYDRLIFHEGLTPIKRWGRPVDVARAVLAIALDYFPFSTGEVLNVDGGFHMRRL
ncbi:3-ketoacyl-ACP reductase [candidate division KSB1 bacterium]|nr:MAG: 3-ketoacyl-ACP reductase [candidate division KSB1 bacterium]